MVKIIVPKENWKEIEPAFKRGGIQYYFLRVDRQDYSEDNYSCIEEVLDHEPTEKDKTNLYNAWLNMEKAVKIVDIEKYDVSDNVNIFEVNNVATWLDKATRVGLVNSVTIEKKAGHTNTTLYLNDIALILPVDSVLSILSELELYAINCYRTTEAHKAAINAMDVIEDVINYDITQNYPEHPKFTV